MIGGGAMQKGSLVCSDYTRSDFAHNMPLSVTQIHEVERIVNRVVMMNYPVTTANMNYDEAISHGAMALFGEKYTDNVRVIKMGEFSTELCGGTHVSRTGDIGFFKILGESGVSNGVRRIEAITGEVALNYVQHNIQVLSTLCATLKAQTNDIVIDKVNNLLEEKTQLTKHVNELNSKIATYSADKLLDKVVRIHDNIALLVLEQNNLDGKSLLELVDKLKNKLGDGVIVIGNVIGDKRNTRESVDLGELNPVTNEKATKEKQKIDLVVAVTANLTNKYNAPTILNHLTSQLGGRGGGRPDLARGACIANAIDLTAVLNSVQNFMEIQ